MGKYLQYIYMIKDLYAGFNRHLLLDNEFRNNSIKFGKIFEYTPHKIDIGMANKHVKRA